jgi:hypothetical protein
LQQEEKHSNKIKEDLFDNMEMIAAINLSKWREFNFLVLISQSNFTQLNSQFKHCLDISFHHDLIELRMVEAFQGVVQESLLSS